MIERAQDGTSVNIVIADERDLDALVGLFNDYRVFYDCEPELQSTKHFITRRLEERTTRFFLATFRNTVVGFIHLLPSFDTLAMKKAWILEDLFVDPMHRRRGIGAALLHHADVFARSTGATRVSLTTAHTNVTAQRLYLAHGYVLDDVFRTYHRMLQ